jgi:DNA repair exonuclease SbcCD ATPase subunit
MGYERFEVELPWPGLILVTGENGQGKSALLEAVATAFFGKTLRGTSPWRSGEAGWVRAFSGDLHSKRRVTAGGSKKLEWGNPDPVAYPTVTKAQSDLTELIGDFETWRRCSVFTGQEAELFSLATDQQRKKFLESVLGLDRFDGALKACREDLRDLREQKRQLERDLEHQERSIGTHQDRVEDLEKALSMLSVPDLDPVETEVEIEQLTRRWDQLRANVDFLKERADKLQEMKTRTGYRLESIRSEIKKTKNGMCVTCGQSISPETTEWLEEGEKKTKSDLARIVAEWELVRTNRSKYREECDEIGGELEDLESDLEAFERDDEHRVELQERLKKAQAEVDEVSQSLVSARDALGEVEADLEGLTIVEKILGIRGVRARVLGQALNAIEELANSYLMRLLDQECRIQIRQTTETKSGEVDAISLLVEPLGGGEGYRALSTGQRRRVDMSILLALSILADASRGRDSGTLFLDEVFDGLDAPGLVAVGQIVEEIAEERAVVVVSHHPILVQHLKPRLWLHVEDQKITTRAA